MYRMFAIASLLLMCCPRPTAARFVDMRGTMSGLPGVHVLVEDIAQDNLKRLGITVDFVQTQIELRLREHGIRVLTNAEWLETEGPMLWVTSQFLTHENGMVAFRYSFGLAQVVRMANGNDCLAVTWQANTLHSVGGVRLRESVGSVVCEMADGFSNDFLAANPSLWSR